jgi:glucoamylase
MPLCWSHAEYLSLVRSVRDGVVFDRVEPAYQRYVVHRPKHGHDMWSARHPIRHMPGGQTLRLLLTADATIVWSTDAWTTTNKTDTVEAAGLGVWFADLPTSSCAEGSILEFTFFWKQSGRWEGRNYSLVVIGAGPTSGTAATPERRDAP